MIQRQHFICSAIEKCKETVNCCQHKKPHIKDEACVPRVCRYVPDVERVDCDPYDPANPRAPIILPPEPVKTVEQVMKEKIREIEPEMTSDPENSTGKLLTIGEGKNQEMVVVKGKTEPKKRAGKQRGKKGSGA